MKKQKVARYNGIVLRTCFSFLRSGARIAPANGLNLKEKQECSAVPSRPAVALPRCLRRHFPKPRHAGAAHLAEEPVALKAVRTSGDSCFFWIYLRLCAKIITVRACPSGLCSREAQETTTFFQSDRSVMLMQHKKSLWTPCAAFALRTPPASSAQGSPREGVVLAGVCEPACRPALVRDPS